jgi:hypothetical protein
LHSLLFGWCVHHLVDGLRDVERQVDEDKHEANGHT